MWLSWRLSWWTAAHFWPATIAANERRSEAWSRKSINSSTKMNQQWLRLENYFESFKKLFLQVSPSQNNNHTMMATFVRPVMKAAMMKRPELSSRPGWTRKWTGDGPKVWLWTSRKFVVRIRSPEDVFCSSFPIPIHFSNLILSVDWLPTLLTC